MAEKSGPFIPKAHEQYDLLPLCRAEGNEVISYPAELSAIEELIREHEGTEQSDANQGRLLLPQKIRAWRLGDAREVEVNGAISFVRLLPSAKDRDQDRGFDEAFPDPLEAMAQMQLEAGF